MALEMDGTKRRGVNSTESLQTNLEVQLEGRKLNLNENEPITSAIFYFCNKRIEREPKETRIINFSVNTFTEFLDTTQFFCDDFNHMWTHAIILELWKTVIDLQIPELIAIIEKKVGRIMCVDNIETIYGMAYLYQSHAIVLQTRLFLQRLYIKADEMHLYCILSFKDFLSIIKDDCIQVESEDIVLRSIFLWAEKQEGSSGASEDGQQCPKRKVDCNVPCKEENELNENTSELSQLLRASRYGLASIECLRELSKHHLCQKDKEAKLVITEAINYKLDRNTHGYWPPFAYPRSFSDIELVGVLADNNQVSLTYLETSKIETWESLPRCPLHTQIENVTVFDNELYVITSTDNESLIFVFRNRKWKFVIDIPNKDFIVISKGSFIYVIDGTSSSVKCVSPRETPVLHSEIKFPDMMRTPESALDFDKSILIFCSADSDERSAVISLDVPEHKWTDCGHLEGSAKNLVGFRNETNYFILQRDGSLSQVLRKLDDSIDFIFLQRLWSIQSALRGAFIYRDILYVFSNTPLENVCLHRVLGLFWRTDYRYQEEKACNFAIVLMLKYNDVFSLRLVNEPDFDPDDD
ncbi:kelch-like protein 8 [Biomphalaria glabrata]|nr:kelch-like protein 8 [Biomphalaria glabrata]